MDNINIQCIVDNLFSVLPLFKKKLFKPNKCIEEIDLSPSHLQILFFLNGTGSSHISDIGKGLNISKPNMTPLIKKLINKKLVKKVRDEKDKRYVNIEITDKGKELVSKHKLFAAQNLRDKLSKLSVKDLEKLYNALNELKEVISKIE